MSKTRTPAELARLCRQQAGMTTNRQGAQVLIDLAERFEKEALATPQPAK